MNQQAKSAAEIEAEEDAAQRQIIEQHRPYTASAHEVQTIAEQLKEQTNRLNMFQQMYAGDRKRIADIENQLEQFLILSNERFESLETRLVDLEEHTGIGEHGVEPLNEVIDTNAEHIGECLTAITQRLAKLEAIPADSFEQGKLLQLGRPRLSMVQDSQRKELAYDLHPAVEFDDTKPGVFTYRRGEKQLTLPWCISLFSDPSGRTPTGICWPSASSPPEWLVNESEPRKLPAITPLSNRTPSTFWERVSNVFWPHDPHRIPDDDIPF